MNLPYRIAVRYFFSKNKRSFISLIARIAMVGVAIGTMALVVVLSVFNGMEDLNRNIFRTFDADVTIKPAKGRRFSVSDSLVKLVSKAEGVRLVTQVIEDNALAVYNNQQSIIRLKGVDSTFTERGQLDTAMIEGDLRLYGKSGTPFALLSEGVRNSLSISLEDILIPLELLYPNTQTKTINFNSTEAFNQISVRPAGVFFIETRYDDYVIVPLAIAENLLQYQGQRSSFEIQVKPGYTEQQVSKNLGTLLGDKFVVKDRDSMNADLLRAISVEKLFVTVTLSFIILVAGINIFFSLSMLAIEKEKDITMLYALGATPSLVRNIFLMEGAIVAFSGAIVGIIAGIAICWAQMRYGLVSMGMASSIVDAYPVKLIWKDILLAGAIIVMITLAVSFVPARRAAQTAELVKR